MGAINRNTDFCCLVKTKLSISLKLKYIKER